MPLPLTVSCFSKVQIGFTFLVPADPGSPLNGCVCVALFFVVECGCSTLWRAVKCCLRLRIYPRGNSSAAAAMYLPVTLPGAESRQWQVQGMAFFFCSVCCWFHCHGNMCLQCFDCWLGDRKGIRPVKNRVVWCCCGCLSGARCRLAYGPADATATHCLLLH